MKNYYLIAQENILNRGHYDVFVSDNPNRGTVLMTFKAQNFTDANKKFCFRLDSGLDYAFISVSPRPLFGVYGAKYQKSNDETMSVFRPFDESVNTPRICKHSTNL